MRRKITTFVAVIGAVFIMTSCMSTKSNSARTMEITKTGVIQNTVIVDIDIKEKKVTGVATGKVTATASVKVDAVVEALKPLNADLLVEPSYSTVTSGSNITITVTGFPAYYKNFRPLTKKEIPLLNAGKVKSLNTVSPSDKK